MRLSDAVEQRIHLGHVSPHRAQNILQEGLCAMRCGGIQCGRQLDDTRADLVEQGQHRVNMLARNVAGHTPCRAPCRTPCCTPCCITQRGDHIFDGVSVVGDLALLHDACGAFQRMSQAQQA